MGGPTSPPPSAQRPGGGSHSPHTQGHGLLGLLRGVWHSHIGWIFKPDPPHLSRYVKDLRQSRLLRYVSALFPVWVLVGLLIPTVLGGVLTLSWSGAWLGLIWGGLVRIFFVHHVTWSVNSICHIWGGQPYNCHDQSRNNFLFGILAMGEGWHNNHHAFPTSARHGLAWYEFDPSWLTLKVLRYFGIARAVRVAKVTSVLAEREAA